MLNNTVYYINQSLCNIIVSVNKRICIVDVTKYKCIIYSEQICSKYIQIQIGELRALIFLRKQDGFMFLEASRQIWSLWPQQSICAMVRYLLTACSGLFWLQLGDNFFQFKEIESLSILRAGRNKKNCVSRVIKNKYNSRDVYEVEELSEKCHISKCHISKLQIL